MAKSAKIKAPDANPVGRPTLYKPEYCEMLEEHMAQGLSYESFAGVIGVCKQTIYSWEIPFKDFLDAKSRGLEKSRLFWEKLGLEGIWNMSGEGSRNLNNVVWVFNMKNRFGWRDKQPDEETTQESGTRITMEDAMMLAKFAPKK